MIKNFRITGKTVGHVATFDWINPFPRIVPSTDNIKLMKCDGNTSEALGQCSFYIEPRHLGLDLRVQMLALAIGYYAASGATISGSYRLRSAA